MAGGLLQHAEQCRFLQRARQGEHTMSWHGRAPSPANLYPRAQREA